MHSDRDEFRQCIDGVGDEAPAMAEAEAQESPVVRDPVVKSESQIVLLEQSSPEQAAAPRRVVIKRPSSRRPSFLADDSSDDAVGGWFGLTT